MSLREDRADEFTDKILPGSAGSGSALSSSFLAIARDENTPVAYPYSSTLTIIRGSYGAYNAVKSSPSTKSLT